MQCHACEKSAVARITWAWGETNPVCEDHLNQAGDLSRQVRREFTVAPLASEMTYEDEGKTTIIDGEDIARLKGELAAMAAKVEDLESDRADLAHTIKVLEERNAALLTYARRFEPPKEV